MPARNPRIVISLLITSFFNNFFGNQPTNKASWYFLRQNCRNKVLPLTTAARNGYTFNSWILENGTPVTSATVFTGNVTVYAKWTYIDNGGSSGNSSGNSDDSGHSDSDSYTISVPKTVGGTLVVKPQYASKGNTVTITATPNSGYELEKLTVTDSKKRELLLTNEGGGAYTFIMPDGRVSLIATFRLIPQQMYKSFTDVSDNYWAKVAIEWANANDYMNGLTATTFNPEGSVTRQQMWMILARLSGQNPSNMEAARAWAVSNGISDGTNPGGAVTRQQMVTLLYRYCVLRGLETFKNGDLSGYSDSNSVSDYAKDAMMWAVGNGIVNGTTARTLNPGGTATRAQFATILKRFCETTINA